MADRQHLNCRDRKGQHKGTQERGEEVGVLDFAYYEALPGRLVGAFSTEGVLEKLGVVG